MFALVMHSHGRANTVRAFSRIAQAAGQGADDLKEQARVWQKERV